MKRLRSLALIALLSGLAGVARAEVGPSEVIIPDELRTLLVSDAEVDRVVKANDDRSEAVEPVSRVEVERRFRDCARVHGAIHCAWHRDLWD